ncbi:hypothetical protein QCA50_020248 [Cerrena zonata]|uniref:Uncharacterized protein n=1 Tax=Cerrena zonata TaxID=2478898 RepID=A0AAW0FJH2_9APHY
MSNADQPKDPEAQPLAGSEPLNHNDEGQHVASNAEESQTSPASEESNQSELEHVSQPQEDNTIAPPLTETPPIVLPPGFKPRGRPGGGMAGGVKAATKPTK